MKEIHQGVELIGINKLVIGVIYFDQGNLYFACAQGKLPIILKDIRSETIKQIGDFFNTYGNYPERAATRLDFSNKFLNIQFKIDNTYTYVITKEISLQFYPLAPTELKKVGAWLKKQAKIEIQEME